MGDSSSSVDWDKDIYAKGQQLNLWPYTSVVSTFYRHKARWSENRAPKVLEIGCGAGNNLWALADIGFEVFGVEQSETAVKFAKERLSSLGFISSIEVGGMTDLPFGDESFDFVLDRGGITQVPINQVPQVSSEVHRVLRGRGVFHSFTLFGENHPSKKLGTLLDNGSYDQFTGGYFKVVGLTSFFSYESLQELFAQFEDLSIERISHETDGVLDAEEYALTAKKP